MSVDKSTVMTYNATDGLCCVVRVDLWVTLERA